MGGAPRHYNGCCSYFCQMEPSGLADTTAQVRNSFRITSAVARGLRESAIIALGVVALVVFTALVSYSPDDPGFSFTGNSSVVHNRIGPIGAWVADVLFFLFGRPAFLFRPARPVKKSCRCKYNSARNLPCARASLRLGPRRRNAICMGIRPRTPFSPGRGDRQP